MDRVDYFAGLALQTLLAENIRLHGLPTIVSTTMSNMTKKALEIAREMDTNGSV